MSRAESPLSLDELIALNDEIAALVRAGVPLDRGLLDLGKDLPARLSAIATELGKTMGQGASLDQILAQDDTLPASYRALVTAGVRSGRLPVVLESLSTSLRRMAQLRRVVLLSLIYPLALLGLAYGLFVWIVAGWTPTILDAYQQPDLEAGYLLRTAASIGNSAAWWAPWPPLFVAMVVALRWRRSSRPAAGNDDLLKARLPIFKRALRAGRWATFAEVLSLLVEHEIPLAEALTLAGDASGDRELQDAARDLSQKLEAGESATVKQTQSGLPPLLSWMIANSSGEQLPAALRQLAETYRQRAERAGDWIMVYLPILFATVVGGVAVLLLAITLLGPWVEALFEMGKP